MTRLNLQAVDDGSRLKTQNYGGVRTQEGDRCTDKRQRPTNLKRSRGERVSWGQAEVKSTGTGPVLQRRHKGQEVSWARRSVGHTQDTEPAWQQVRNPPCPCPRPWLQLCPRRTPPDTTAFTQKRTVTIVTWCVTQGGSRRGFSRTSSQFDHGLDTLQEPKRPRRKD